MGLSGPTVGRYCDIMFFMRFFFLCMSVALASWTLLGLPLGRLGLEFGAARRLFGLPGEADV